MPKFSIIIPVYNVAKYLNQCIESVLAQNYKDYEIILIDDGSTDESGSMCDEYSTKFSNIATIHQNNGGLSVARNTGIKNATGNHVLFLDSDDYWCDNKFLSKLSTQIEKENADVIVYNFVKEFERNNTREEKRTEQVSLPEEKAEAAKILLITGLFSASVCFKCISRQLIIDNNLFFEEGKFSEDIEWSARLLIVAKSLSCINECFYVYRQRAGSISHTIKEENFTHLFQSVAKIKQYAKDYSLSEPFLSIYFAYVAYQYATMCFCINLLETKELRKKWTSKVIPNKKLLNFGYGKKVKLLNFARKIVGLKMAIKLMYAIRNKNA